MLNEIREVRKTMKPSQWVEKMLPEGWHLISDYNYNGGVQVLRATLFTLIEYKELIEKELIPIVPAPVEFIVKYVTKQELRDITEMTK